MIMDFIGMKSKMVLACVVCICSQSKVIRLKGLLRRSGLEGPDWGTKEAEINKQRTVSEPTPLVLHNS